MLLKIIIDIKSLKFYDKIDEIEFNVSYVDIKEKCWREQILDISEFISKGVKIKINCLEVAKTVKICINTLNKEGQRIESIPDEFEIMKSAIYGGAIVAGLVYQSPVKIQVFEDLNATDAVECQYTYRLEVDYNPNTVPCDDMEKVKAIFYESTENGLFELAEVMIDDNLNELTESNSAYHSGNLEITNKHFGICFSTVQFLGRKGYMSKRKFMIELFNIEDGNIIARSKVFMLNQILKVLGKRSSTFDTLVTKISFNNLSLLNGSTKNKAKYLKTLEMNIVQVSKIKSISMFSYFAAREIKVVPFFGLDFSQANLTFDDDICLHRTKENKPKIYLDLLRKLTNAIRFFSTDYCISYAFGCKANANSSTSDCLALSGDYFNPHICIQDIENRYKATVNKIEFALPPNHSTVFK